MHKIVSSKAVKIAERTESDLASRSRKRLKSSIRALVPAGILCLTALQPLPALANQSCANASHLHSLNSDNPTTITFVNDAPGSREIWWIDFNGQRKSYGEVDPGDQKTIDTFITHPWIVSNEMGACVKVVVPQPGGSIVKIRN